MNRLLILALLFLLSLTGSAFAQDIKIGLMGPITGAWANEGQDMERMLDLLVTDLNDKGGIKGQKVILVVEDDGGTPLSAALAARRLVSNGVIAVVGTYGSAVTEASQAIYNEAKVVQIATGSTAIRLTAKKFNFFFRTCPRDDDQGKAMAAAASRLGFKNVAIVHDNSAYAKGLADEVEPLLRAQKVNILYFDAITPGERDYSTILTKLSSLKPDGIIFTGYYPEAGMLLRQMQEIGWQAPMLGGDATNNRGLVEIAGVEAASGYYFISPPGPQDLTSQLALDFMGRYKVKYGDYPRSIWAVLAGDAFNVLAAAIAAKGVQAEDIAEFLHNELQDFEGFSGKISFDEKGDREGDLYRLYRVDEQGSFVLQP
jgi:branched-chain amino acid transport system substrate-binding protein